MTELMKKSLKKVKNAVDYWVKESSVEGLTYPFIGVTGRQRGDLNS